MRGLCLFLFITIWLALAACSSSSTPGGKDGQDVKTADSDNPDATSGDDTSVAEDGKGGDDVSVAQPGRSGTTVVAGAVVSTSKNYRLVGTLGTVGGQAQSQTYQTRTGGVAVTQP